MKKLVIACVCFLFAMEALSANVKFEILTTTDGTTYKSVTVREVTPAGIRVFYSAGVAAIPFEKLPKEIQEQLGGFDPKKATAYRAKQNQKQKAIRRNIEIQHAEAMAKLKEKAEAGKAARQLEKEQAERIEKLAAKKQRFGVEILRILPKGAVANVLVTKTKGVGSQRIGGGGGGTKTTITRTNKVIFIEGLSGIGETQRTVVVAAPSGKVFSYETPTGRKRTLEKWVLLEEREKTKTEPAKDKK
jgi:hypothetical protein